MLHEENNKSNQKRNFDALGVQGASLHPQILCTLIDKLIEFIKLTFRTDVAMKRSTPSNRTSGDAITQHGVLKHYASVAIEAKL